MGYVLAFLVGVATLRGLQVLFRRTEWFNLLKKAYIRQALRHGGNAPWGPLDVKFTFREDPEGFPYCSLCGKACPMGVAAVSKGGHGFFCVDCLADALTAVGIELVQLPDGRTMVKMPAEGDGAAVCRTMPKRETVN